MQETILALVKEMPVCSGMSDALLGALVSAAQAELERRLPEDVTAQSLGGRFTLAAAMLAASMAANVSGGAESLKAGSLTVTQKESGHALAAALRKSAFALLADTVAPDDCVFLGVEAE